MSDIAAPLPTFRAAFGSRKRREFIEKIAYGAVGFILLIAAWQYASTSLGIAMLLPSPVAVANTIYNTLFLNVTRWLYGPNIYVHLLGSAQRALTGFVIAAAIAIPLGLIVGRVRRVRLLIMPLVLAVYPIPSVAWIPLALLWFGLTPTAIIFVVIMSEFFPLFFNTEAGARHVSPTVTNAGRCFGAKGINLFVRVILPSAFPSILTGMRLGLGQAWRSIVAVEMFAAQYGIGYMLMEARFQFRAADLLMAMILIAVIGYTTEKLLIGTLEKRTIERWEVKQT